MILYEHPLSPYAQKVKIALREKGLPFELRLPTAIGSGADDAVLRRLNPRMEVPALIDGDLAIFDSTIMLEYIEDSHPTPPLRPAKAADRARARMIEEVCDTHYEAINWGLGEIRFFGRGGPVLGEQLRQKAVEQTGHLQAWLQAALGDKEWLVGDAFGWADLSAAPFVAMSGLFGIPPQPGSALAAWLDRVRQRPTVATTVAEAMATTTQMEGIGELLRSGLFKREFRDHRLEWMIRSGGMQVVLDGLATQNIRFTETAQFVAPTA